MVKRKRPRPLLISIQKKVDLSSRYSKIEKRKYTKSKFKEKPIEVRPITGRLYEYRSLDFDDLIICSLLAEKISHTHIAIYLSLTPPAISHRLKKFRGLWPTMFILDEKRNNNHKITEEGIEICKKMKEIACFLLDRDPNEDFAKSIRDTLSSRYVEMLVKK